MGSFYAGYIVGAFLTALFGFLFVVVPLTSPNRAWQDSVVERGYGLYCPNTGHFAFKGECDG